jgi:glycosyltransferase involved in cell wall biosynthesis
VIPAYNAEAFLGQALESVRAQSAPASQVIVIDDGSEDGTAALAKTFPEVHLIPQPNAGIGAARNTGVRAATGELLAFLDADDLWPPDSLSLRLEALAVAEGVFGCVEQFGAGHDGEPPELAFVAGSMLIRRAAFDRAGFFDESVAVGEFIDWYARAQEAGVTFATLERVVLRRRIHTTNTGIVKRDQAVDYTRVLRRALARRREGAGQ